MGSVALKGNCEMWICAMSEKRLGVQNHRPRGQHQATPPQSALRMQNLSAFMVLG